MRAIIDYQKEKSGNCGGGGGEEENFYVYIYVCMPFLYGLCVCVYVYVMFGRYRKVKTLLRMYEEEVSKQAC